MSDIIAKIQAAKAIRLDCPRSLPGKYWRPGDEAAILGRVDALEPQPPGSLPQVGLPKTVDVSDTPDETLTITLTHRYGRGYRCWDVYDASVGDDTGIIAKVVDFSCLGSGEAFVETLASYPREFHIYNHHCVSLQGSIIPRLGGLFGNAQGTLWCTLYEDAGRKVKWADREDESIGHQALEAVETTQALGVTTCPHSCQWLRIDDSDGTLKITEFEEAYTVDTFDAATLASITSRTRNYLNTVEAIMESTARHGLENVKQFFGLQEDGYAEAGYVDGCPPPGYTAPGFPDYDPAKDQSRVDPGP